MKGFWIVLVFIFIFNRHSCEIHSSNNQPTLIYKNFKDHKYPKTTKILSNDVTLMSKVLKLEEILSAQMRAFSDFRFDITNQIKVLRNATMLMLTILAGKRDECQGIRNTASKIRILHSALATSQPRELYQHYPMPLEAPQKFTSRKISVDNIFHQNSGQRKGDLVPKAAAPNEWEANHLDPMIKSIIPSIMQDKETEFYVETTTIDTTTSQSSTELTSQSTKIKMPPPVPTPTTTSTTTTTTTAAVMTKPATATTTITTATTSPTTATITTPTTSTNTSTSSSTAKTTTTIARAATPELFRCPTGSQKVGMECFSLHLDLQLNWTSARSFCRSWGGDLAEPQLGNNRLPKQMLKTWSLLKTSQYWTMWIGATDVEREGEWHWVTGGLLDLKRSSRWNMGEPPDDGKDCLALILSIPSRWRRWDLVDDPCDLKWFVFCEYAKVI